MIGLQLFVFVCVVFVVVKLERIKKRRSGLLFYVLKLLDLYSLLLTTIAPIPLFQIFFVAIICRDNDPFHGSATCYQGVQLGNMVVGVVGVFCLTIFSFVTQLLYVELNPSSTIPLAASQSKIGLFKLAMKIALPLYVTIDYNVMASYLTFI